MSLKPVLGGLEGTAGKTETIQIAPVGPHTVNRILSIRYGVDENGDPISVPVDDSGDSFTIEVRPGTDLLQVLFVSSSPKFQTLVAQQPPGGDGCILQDDIAIIGGTGDWSPQVTGNPARQIGGSEND